VSNLLVIYMEI